MTESMQCRVSAGFLNLECRVKRLFRDFYAHSPARKSSGKCRHYPTLGTEKHSLRDWSDPSRVIQIARPFTFAPAGERKSDGRRRGCIYMGMDTKKEAPRAIEEPPRPSASVESAAANLPLCVSSGHERDHDRSDQGEAKQKPADGGGVAVQLLVSPREVVGRFGDVVHIWLVESFHA